MVTYSSAEKGDQIRIIGGKYHGRNGWRWVGKTDTPKFTYVIVPENNGIEKGTRVMKENVGAPLEPPKNYVDAALQQHTEIDRTFTKLCKSLAKCNLTGDEKELQDAFLEKMHAANAMQHAGESATWFGVDFKGGKGRKSK